MRKVCRMAGRTFTQATPPRLRPLPGLIDPPWPLGYFSVCPKRAFEKPILQLLVTHLSLPPREVWRLYHQRADSENRVAELIHDFRLTVFCVDSFWGTEAAFYAVILAYNLMSLFRQALWQHPKAVKLSTLRPLCFALGAWVGRRGRSEVLQISVPPPTTALVRRPVCPNFGSS